MNRTKLTRFLVTVLAVGSLGLAGCNAAGIRAANADRILMAETLANALVKVGETPNATDDFAMGVLIGQGTFTTQDADTFVDYARGAGYFFRETLPWAQLFFKGGNSYDGAMFEAGGNILFDSTLADGKSSISQWNQYGNDQSFAPFYESPTTTDYAPIED